MKRARSATITSNSSSKRAKYCDIFEHIYIMKRARSATITSNSSSKRAKYCGINIVDLPDDILSEILSLVGAHATRDLANAKISCKTFTRVGEYSLVYRRLIVKPFIRRRPILGCPTKTEKYVLDRCLESCNPEIMYRRALDAYCLERKDDYAMTLIRKCVQMGLEEAQYFECAVNLFSDKSESRQDGLNWLAKMMSRPTLVTLIPVLRWKFMTRLHWTEGNMDRFTRRAFCTPGSCSPVKEEPINAFFYERNFKCVLCVADWQIKKIFLD